MLVFYLILIGLAAFPMLLIIWRMRTSATVKKNGVPTTAVVKHINTVRGKGGTIDLLSMEYKDSATNQYYKARATVAPHQYKIGDTMPLMYLPNKPSKYAIDTKKGYLFLLIFCVVLFLFILFAVYKLNEMTHSGHI